MMDDGMYIDMRHANACMVTVVNISLHDSMYASCNYNSFNKPPLQLF